MTTLSDSSKRVQDYIHGKGFPCEVKVLESSARTAQEAADSLACTVAQIAKSLIFKDAATLAPILIVASGANRVDIAKVEKTTGLSLLKAEGAYVKEKVGYAIGGIPPAGHTQTLTTLLDEDLKQYPLLWAAAGTPHTVFPLTPETLGALTNGKWLALAE